MIRTLCATLVAFCVMLGAEARAEEAPTVPAVWKQHELTLGYQGLTTDYSCRGLADKMESLLVYFGAREEGLKVSAYGCVGGPYQPSPAINLKLRFETLVPAQADASGVVEARWAERQLFADKKIQQNTPQRIRRGDCEVVQKFTAKVLPSFTHETVHDLTTCIPHQLSGSIPNLLEKVLVPVEAEA